MCFMALNDEVEIQNSLANDDILYDDLSIVYDELLTNFEKLATKTTLLKKKNASHSIELEQISVLEKENENLTSKNILLKERVDDLTKVVHKFTLGKKTFDMMISEQRCVFNKQGLSFKPTLKQNYQLTILSRLQAYHILYVTIAMIIVIPHLIVISRKVWVMAQNMSG